MSSGKQLSPLSWLLVSLCLGTQAVHGFNMGLSNGLGLPFLQNIPGLQNLFSSPVIGRGFETGINTQPGHQGFNLGGGRNILGLFGTQRGVSGGFDENGQFQASLGNNWSAMKGLVQGGSGLGARYDPNTGQLGFSRTSGIAPFFGTNRGINLDLGSFIKKPVK